MDRLYRCSEGFEIDDNIDQEFLSALSKDLNTPLAISRLHELAKEFNKGNRLSGQLLKSSSRILGLLNVSSSEWFTKKDQIDEEKINNMISERNKARKEKDFHLADKIRDELKSIGVSIEDKANETKWRLD